MAFGISQTDTEASLAPSLSLLSPPAGTPHTLPGGHQDYPFRSLSDLVGAQTASLAPRCPRYSSERSSFCSLLCTLALTSRHHGSSPQEALHPQPPPLVAFRTASQGNPCLCLQPLWKILEIFSCRPSCWDHTRSYHSSYPGSNLVPIPILLGLSQHLLHTLNTEHWLPLERCL